LTCIHPGEVDYFVDALGLEGPACASDILILFSLCIRPPGAMAMDLVEALLGIRYG
jgi:hypothetical protein